MRSRSSCVTSICVSCRVSQGSGLSGSMDAEGANQLRATHIKALLLAMWVSWSSWSLMTNGVGYCPAKLPYGPRLQV